MNIGQLIVREKKFEKKYLAKQGFYSFIYRTAQLNCKRQPIKRDGVNDRKRV